MPSLVVLGARGLGGAILDRFLADGWSAAAVARSADTLGAVRARGAVAIEADATDPQRLAGALTRARDELGRLDLVVNALSVTPVVADGEPWGGGPIADADLDGWERWTGAIGRASFVFLSEGARALRAAGTGGTLIQISNGAAIRPSPGGALVAGGQHALRALSRGAAQELRPEGIRVCLLVVDASIRTSHGTPEGKVADRSEIVNAVAFLEAQGPGGTVYELTIRPSGLPWLVP